MYVKVLAPRRSIIRPDQQDGRSACCFLFFSFVHGRRLKLQRSRDATCLSYLVRTGLSQQLVCAPVGWELESDCAAAVAPMVLGSVEKTKEMCALCPVNLWPQCERLNALMF